MTSQQTFDPSEFFQSVFGLLEQRLPEQAEALVKQRLRQQPDWAPAHSLLAAVAMQQGQPQQAEAAFAQAFALDPSNPDYAFNLLQLLCARQKQAEALQICREGLSKTLADAELGQLAGRILLEAGETELALDWLLKAEQLAPQAIEPLQSLLQTLCSLSIDLACRFVPALAHSHPARQVLLETLGDQLLRARDLNRAEYIWRQTTAANRGAGIWHNLGLLAFEREDLDEARMDFEKALARDASFVPARFYLGLIQLRQAEYEQGRDQIAQALQEQPGLAAKLYQLASLYYQNQQEALSAECLALCEPYVAHLPESAERYWRDRAHCAHFLCQDELKVHYFERARQYAGNKLNGTLETLFCLPYVYQSIDEIQQTRRAISFGLDKLQSRLPVLLSKANSKLELHLNQTFMLAYHGLNDRTLMVKSAEIWKQFLNWQGKLTQECHPPKSGRRIRVGYVSELFYKHSVLLCYGQMIAAFGADADFECLVFHSGQIADEDTLWLSQQVNGFFHVPNPETAKNAILAQKLDVLIYTDIGMTQSSYLLAFQRLAPIQCLMGGHPVTSGIPTIDYFFSSVFAEPPNPESHYSETPILFRERTGRMLPVEPIENPSRPACWAKDRHIYFCPMTLIKIHPDFDDLIEGILQQDPLGEVWFVRDVRRPIDTALARRFAGRMPELASRIHFMPWMKTRDFYQAVQTADVILDSLHFGAGTTARMTLGLLQPMVTLPGEFVRGRITMGYYRQMGLDDWISHSKQDYVARCLRLAQDKAWRHELSLQLRERVPVIFEPPRGLPALKNFLRQAVAQYPTPMRGLDG